MQVYAGRFPNGETLDFHDLTHLQTVNLTSFPPIISLEKKIESVL